MIATGDHLDVDPRRLAFSDRLNRFGSRRVDQPDQAKQRQAALFDIREFKCLGPMRRGFEGEGENTLASRREPVDCSAPRRWVQRFVAASHERCEAFISSRTRSGARP